MWEDSNESVEEGKNRKASHQEAVFVIEATLLQYMRSVGIYNKISVI